MDIVFQRAFAEALRYGRYGYAALWLSVMRASRSAELKRRRRLARRQNAFNVSPVAHVVEFVECA